MTYGDPQGYRSLRELVCEKYERFEFFSTTPDNIIVANGSGHALSLAFSAFVDPGDVIISSRRPSRARSTPCAATGRRSSTFRWTPKALSPTPCGSA